MIYIVAFCFGLKCPRKIHLNSECPSPSRFWQINYLPLFQIGGRILLSTSSHLDFQIFLRSCLLNIIQVDILCNTKESNHKLCNRKKSECHKDCSTFLLKWRISEQLLHSPWHSNWKLFSMYNVEFFWEGHKNF